MQNFCTEFKQLFAPLGATEGARIAVLLWNRPWHYASIAAVLSMHSTIVTINPAMGTEGLLAELQRVHPTAVVASAEDWARVGMVETVAALTGVLPIELPTEADPAPHLLGFADLAGPVPDRGDPAVAIEMLTSGTTGEPKRVPLRYADLERSLADVRLYHGDPDTAPPARQVHGVTLLCNPPVHMSGMYGCVRALTGGRTVVLLERFSVPVWQDAMIKHRPKVAGLVPAAIRMILDADVDPEVLSSVKVVTTGSAAMPSEVSAAFEERYGVPILISYGATEFAGPVAGWTID